MTVHSFSTFEACRLLGKVTPSDGLNGTNSVFLSNLQRHRGDEGTEGFIDKAPKTFQVYILFLGGFEILVCHPPPKIKIN